MHTSTRSHRLIIASTLLVACTCAIPPLHAARQALSPTDVIAKVKAQFAPDTRLAVFDVKAEAKDNVLEVSGEVDQPAARDAVLAALREAGTTSVFDKIAVLPDPSLGPRQFGVVTVSVATMKSKPSHPAELANQLVMGTIVKVLKSENGWYYAQSQDDRYLGWMEPGHLALMTREVAEAFRAGRRLVVTSVFAVIRERPSPDGSAVSDAVMGNVMRLQRTARGWHSVQLPDGRTGFVAARNGMGYNTWSSSRRITPESIERTARMFMGVPYLWGGTSAKGFDCSGFTKTVFRANGFELLRDADQQSDQGEAVSMENDMAGLKKGDLLFFGPRPGVTRITHVGIYLGGKRFIHCSGMVRINSFDPASTAYSESLLGRLVKVRRVG